jgi:hypothetical protein
MVMRLSHDTRYHLVPQTEIKAEEEEVESSDPYEREPVNPPSPRKPSATQWKPRPLLRLFLLLGLCAVVGLWASPVSWSSLVSHLSSPVVPRPSGLPVLARTISLILCEGQADVDHYLTVVPSITADAIFYCWKDADCGYPTRSSIPHPELTPAFVDPAELRVSAWTSHPNGSVLTRDGRVGLIHRHSSVLITSADLLSRDPLTDPSLLSSLYPVHPSVWVLNEKRLGLKLSWTGSRNHLLSHVQRLEERQGWRWAYLTFMDGDIHLQCDSIKALLPVTQSQIDDALHRGSYHFQFLSFLQAAHEVPLSVRPTDKGELTCTVAYDAFLLTAAPARGTVVGHLSTRVPGVDAQVGYDMDAMLNSLQSSALAFVLPYCERFDSTGWWLSQIHLNARCLCVFGHTLVMNDVQTLEDLQVHRDYPRIDLDAMYVLFDQHKGDLHVYPQKYAELEKSLQKKSAIFPSLLNLYSGWWPDLVEPDCRTHINDTQTCKWLPHTHPQQSEGRLHPP